MKYFKTFISILGSIAFATALNAHVNASTMAKTDQCKELGKQAETIMMKRQATPDMMILLEASQSETEQSMILAAYELPMIDTAGQLSISVKAFGTHYAAAERRKYDTMNAEQKAIIQKFKNSYIASCIKERKKQI